MNNQYLSNPSLKDILLDSSLIFQTTLIIYSLKLVQCGKYYQLYNYNKDKNKSEKDNIIKLNLFDYKNNIKKNIEYSFNIAPKNIIRSKIALQRLVKCNEEDFKTFLTLTFADNIINIDNANYYFNIFRSQLKREFKDLKYICVPEFQKRGAVHYHLLTNIPYDSDLLLEEKKLYNKESGWQVGKPIKFWRKGFSLCKKLDNINVVGYITKYLTKDIDNRLFCKNRYNFSRNLKTPIISYFTLEEFSKYFKESDYTLIYSNTYLDNFNVPIDFREFKKE